MAARIGTAMYVLGNIFFLFNALFWVFAAGGFSTGDGNSIFIPIFLFGLPVWIFGYLCRYVLSGNARV